MKKLNNYAFIVKHKSYSPINQKTLLKSDEFKSSIIGVSNIDDAITEILKLINNGVQLVELCGGFTKNEKKQIKNKINNVIPIGLVKLDKNDIQILESNLL